MKKILLYFAAAAGVVANTVFFAGVCYLSIKGNSGMMAVSGIGLTMMNYALCDSLRGMADKCR